MNLSLRYQNKYFRRIKFVSVLYKDKESTLWGIKREDVV